MWLKIQSTMCSPQKKAKKMWINLFKDPTFVTEFAKSMDDEQMKLVKRLMNDADFQKKMIEILQNPEITEQMLGVMKSQQFRAHMEEIIQQTLRSEERRVGKERR